MVIGPVNMELWAKDSKEYVVDAEDYAASKSVHDAWTRDNSAPSSAAGAKKARKRSAAPVAQAVDAESDADHDEPRRVVDRGPNKRKRFQVLI